MVMKKILVISILLVGAAHISYGQAPVDCSASRNFACINDQDCPAGEACWGSSPIISPSGQSSNRRFCVVQDNRGSCIPPSSMGSGGGRNPSSGSGGVNSGSQGVSPAQSAASAMRSAMEAWQSSSLGRSLAASAQRNCPAAQPLTPCGSSAPGKAHLRIASHTSSDTCPGADFANRCFEGAVGSIVNSTTRWSTQLTDAECRSWACGTPPPPPPPRRNSGQRCGNTNLGDGRLEPYQCPRETPVCCVPPVDGNRGQCGIPGCPRPRRRPNPNPNPNPKGCRLVLNGDGTGTIVCDITRS